MRRPGLEWPHYQTLSLLFQNGHLRLVGPEVLSISWIFWRKVVLLYHSSGCVWIYDNLSFKLIAFSLGSPYYFLSTGSHLECTSWWASDWNCCLLQNLASIVPGLEPAGVDLLSVRTPQSTFDPLNFSVSGCETVGSIKL
jgi:hypothetical protein